jgi:hypothetical protein
MKEQSNQIKAKDYYQIISLNTQKGDVYEIKFNDDDIIYQGIPSLCAGCSPHEEEFTFKIVRPAGKKEVLEKTTADIEYMKNVS